MAAVLRRKELINDKKRSDSLSVTHITLHFMTRKKEEKKEGFAAK